MKIEKYQVRGKTKYRFQAYLGIDDLTGKQIMKKRSGFDSRKEAEIAYLSLMHKEEEATSGRRRYIDVYEEWFAQYRKGVKSSSANKTKELFDLHILPDIGDYFVDAIQLKHMQKLANTLADQLVNHKKCFQYAKRVFEYAIKIGLRNDNPCQYVEFVVKGKDEIEEEHQEENFYDKEELVNFLVIAKEHALQQWYVFFRLLAFSGMRKAEALALTWGDVDFKNKQISVVKNLSTGEGNKIYVTTPKTKASKRVIELDQGTMSTLKEWRLEQNKILSKLGYKTLNKDQLVFATLKNEHWPLSNPNHRLNSLIKNHNLKQITVHGFRHTHCSMMFEAGATIPEVQKRLGHSDIQTTMNIYNHVSKAKKEEAIDKLANYLAF